MVPIRDQGNLCSSLRDSVHLQSLEHGIQYIRILTNFAQCFTDPLRADRAGLSKLSGPLPFSRAGNNIHLVITRLAYSRSNLAQSVNHFLFDLTDHLRIAEMHFSYVNRAQLITPFLRL